MKAVLISIQPKWCELIASGKKTVEVRKTKPKLETPFKVYIYCTKSKNQFLQSRSNMFFYCESRDTLGGHGAGLYRRLNGKVIGEFVCDKIIDIDYGIEEGVYFDGEYQEGFETNGNGNNPTCLSFTELENYLTENVGYGWHISNLVIYDKPRELSEFRTLCKHRNADGSCQYIKVDCDCVKFDFNPDSSVNFAECCDYMIQPPQSWCYVERLGDAE